MGEREGADARERHGVDQEPQRLLDEFGRRFGQRRQPALVPPAPRHRAMNQTAPDAATSRPSRPQRRRPTGRHRRRAGRRDAPTSARASPRQCIWMASSTSPIVMIAMPAMTPASSIVIGSVIGRSHSAGMMSSRQNTLPNRTPNSIAIRPPGTSIRVSGMRRPSTSPAMQHDGALPDIAEHEAEDRRGDDGQQLARIAFVAPGRAEHAREHLEGARPAGIVQHQRRRSCRPARRPGAGCSARRRHRARGAGARRRRRWSSR